MVQVLVVRPGATDFDEQGRIKGTLDIPLSEAGQSQVGRLVGELKLQAIDHIYASPCRCAQQTAKLLAADHRVKVKTLDELQNLDHGLWHGKLIDEVRVGQPKVFRQLQDHPETVCPPQGEPVGAALERAREARQQAEARQPVVTAVAAKLRRAREENHFRERIEAAFRGAP